VDGVFASAANDIWIVGTFAGSGALPPRQPIC
jgi:hypothetical protein